MTSRRKKFGDLIRNLREKNSISFKAFVQNMGANPYYIYKIEQGVFNNLSYNQVIQMANELHYDEDLLLQAASEILPKMKKLSQELEGSKSKKLT